VVDPQCRMLKKSVQQGRSERRGEEVHTALRVGRSPLEGSWRTENLLQCFLSEKPLPNVEPLSDARTPLAGFFSILLRCELQDPKGYARWRPRQTSTG
jgi:hypothetical protein